MTGAPGFVSEGCRINLPTFVTSFISWYTFQGEFHHLSVEPLPVNPPQTPLVWRRMFSAVGNKPSGCDTATVLGPKSWRPRPPVLDITS
jgi:hypothetical protein